MSGNQNCLLGNNTSRCGFVVLEWPLSVHYELTAIIKTLVFVAPLRVASPRLSTKDAVLSKFLILTASERNVIAKKGHQSLGCAVLIESA